MKNNRYIMFCSVADIPQVSGLAMCTRKHPSKYDKRKSFIILIYKQRCNVRDVCATPQSISFLKFV